MAGELQLDGRHWRFALDIYGSPGVSELCLELQDRFGIDVNVLLVALYAAHVLEREVSVERVAELDAAAASWRDEVVTPLRLIRRRLKAGPPPAPGAATEALRETVKAAELDAERIEQALLAVLVEAWDPRADEGPADADGVTRMVVGHYRVPGPAGTGLAEAASLDIDTASLAAALARLRG